VPHVRIIPCVRLSDKVSGGKISFFKQKGWLCFDFDFDLGYIVTSVPQNSVESEPGSFGG
jgi:hypothetical protein